MRIRVEWEEKRDWLPSDGPHEDHPRGVWAKHSGILIYCVDRVVVFRATGYTENHVRAVIYDDVRKKLMDRPLADLTVLEAIDEADHHSGNGHDARNQLDSGGGAGQPTHFIGEPARPVPFV